VTLRAGKMRRSMSCYENTRFTGTGKSSARIRRQKIIRGTILRDLPGERECESESEMGQHFTGSRKDEEG
jgi:hypothetical protein